MAWIGLFQYGDNEVINAARVSAYARNLGLGWVKDCTDNPCINDLLGQPEYTTPAADPAPWYDPYEPGSGEFIGLVPLEVTGIEDSTRSSTGFEYTKAGGNPGRLRSSMKEVVFSAALVASSEKGAEYGFRWLQRALDHPQHVSCSLRTANPSWCSGPGLSFLAHPPTCSGGVIDSRGQSLRRVLINRGPRVTGKRNIGGCDVGAMWLVTWTATAGDPFVYGNPYPVLQGLGVAADPHVPPFQGAEGSTTYTWDPVCNAARVPTYVERLQAPGCPPLPVPPLPPSPGPGCWEEPEGLQTRVWAEVPLTAVPEWDEVRPIVSVTASVDMQAVRIGFYRASEDPASACPSLWTLPHWFVGYIPAGGTLTIDSTDGSAVITTLEGVTMSATHLVTDQGGDPATYIGLSCGETYRMVVDWDPDQTADGVGSVDADLDLIPRSA